MGREGQEQTQKTFNHQALLALYSENEARIRSHRETLWQQVSHFSWLIVIIVTAAGLMLAKSDEFIGVVWMAPFLWIMSCGVGLLAFMVIKQEREEFLRAVMVTRKVEKILGLHKPVQNRELSPKKGFSGYLFRLAHINVFDEAEKLCTENRKIQDAEQRWIDWRIKEHSAPFDRYRYLFLAEAIISVFGLSYSIYFLWSRFEFYFPPWIK